MKYVWERGRLVGAEITRDPEWSQWDVDLVAAVDWWERSLDPAGVPVDEATSVEASPTNYEGGYYYAVGDPVVDWAERARLDAEDRYRKKYEDANMNGLIFPVTKMIRPQR